MAHPQKLRVTKKQAIINQIKKEQPDLTDLYVRKEFYKVTNKDCAKGKISSSVWLKERGITQCCQCRAWDNTKNKYKICPVCLDNKESRIRENFLRFKGKGLELELGY